MANACVAGHMWLRFVRGIGWGVLAGMSFLAFMALVQPEDAEGLRKPEYVSWWFGIGAALVATSMPMLGRGMWGWVALRAAGLLLMHAVFFDVAQVISDDLHWGPIWFTLIVFAAILPAALPAVRSERSLAGGSS